MSVVKVILKQSQPVRILLAKVAFAMCLAKISLMVLSLRQTRKLVAGIMRLLNPAVHSTVITLDRLVWAVSTVGRRLKSTCLIDAIAAQPLFERYGYSTEFCIGAARENGVFTAHAWLERRGEVLVGGPLSKVQLYRPFADLDRRTS